MNTHIAGRWLWPARVVLLAIGALYGVIYALGVPAYFAQLIPAHHACMVDCLTPANVQALHALGLSDTAYAAYSTAINLVFALVYFGVAALIFWRKSDDRMALLAAFFLVTFGASFPSIPTALAAVYPAWSLPVTLLSEGVLGFPSLIVFLLLFPTGRFVPRWTIWVAIGATILFVLGTFFPALTSRWPGSLIIVPVAIAVFGSLIYAQVYRYRRVSTPVERQQTRWIVFAAVVALVGFLLLGVVLSAVERLFLPSQSADQLPTIIVVTSIYLLLLLIPLSLAFALLRHRLWDVDVLINKTLVYGLLTSIIVVIYAGCILASQALLEGLFHQTSAVAIVVSTLLIATLFHPLRRRIQSGIDRRFYRRKYDAARTLAAYSATLRGEVNLNRMCEDLVAVVQETMQPSHVSLWLRSPDHSRSTRLLPLVEIEEDERPGSFASD